MKTINLRVSGLFNGLDNLAIEKRLRRLRGVKDAVMNPASESASVTYDEALTTSEAIKSAIDECDSIAAAKQFRGICVNQGRQCRQQIITVLGTQLRLIAARSGRLKEPRRTTLMQTWVMTRVATCRPWSETCAIAS